MKKRGAIRYSATELAFIEARCAMKRRELRAAFVRAFGRVDVTEHDLKSLCSRKGWTTGRKRFSAEEDVCLRALYPDTPTTEVARRMGREVFAIYQRVRRLGLSKSEAYLASPAACRLRRGDNVGEACRFLKGHAPANKGLRRPGWAPGRMKETQFKKGERGSNWKPIGSERLVAGYHYTKVSDVPYKPWTVNWKATHIVAWEQLHGPMPKGTILKNLDGNRLNTDPSNWELIPRAMLPRLSGIRGRDFDNAPAELKPTIMAAAKLEHAAWERKRSKERAS